MQTDKLKAFIQEHREDDPVELLLGASRYPEVDVPYAAELIAARKQIKDKLPHWYADDSLLFPSKLAAEQCSSEQTARYKQRLAESDWHLADLTGGLGVDSYFFSQKIHQVTYIERFPSYCEAARSNFSALGIGNIRVIQGNSVDLLPELENVDCFYLDPARRGEGNRRVFALSDCEPDLTQLLSRLLRKAPRVIAKLSPMLDIQHTLKQLPGTEEVHVLSVKNECKELLFIIARDPAEKKEPAIYCVNFPAEGEEQSYRFTLAEERESHAGLADGAAAFLYEPNASILKAGAYQSIAIRYGLRKLHPNSHLYTSERRIAFPGRTFVVEESIPCNGKAMKTIAKKIPQANLTVRNFPLSVRELRQRTKIAEGGEVYLFATTLASGAKVLIRCVKPDAVSTE